MYRYLFGPVPSRRLGISLGVDLVPHKTCSFNCIYCECGETINLTIERKEYVPVDGVFKELDYYFKNNPDPDYITFSGSGEPTLNLRIGEVLEFIRDIKPHISIAVLTNGTLLGQEDVKKALLKADLIMPSLDAASISALRAINRPHNSIDVESYIEGLARFRSEFTGIFNLEVFILPDHNDMVEELAALKGAIKNINPDLVQLNTLDRPGVVAGIHAANQKNLQKIAEFLKPFKTEIIAAGPKRKAMILYRNDVESAILETILRRPCTLEDLATILGSHVNEIKKYLGTLVEAEKIESVRQDRGLFYQAKNKFSKE